MNKKMMLGAVLGLAVMGASAAASAHVDVAVGLGVPVETYVPAQPVYAAPVAPVAYGYGPDYNPYWRQHREWREREWRRHHEWREWHERHGWR
jgi:hypothetical protein